MVSANQKRKVDNQKKKIRESKHITKEISSSQWKATKENKETAKQSENKIALLSPYLLILLYMLMYYFPEAKRLWAAEWLKKQEDEIQLYAVYTSALRTCIGSKWKDRKRYFMQMENKYEQEKLNLYHTK